MSPPIAVLIALIGLYLAIGVAFSVWFVLGGAARRDPTAASAPLRVRLLFAPGAVAVWPALLSSPRAQETGD